MVYRQLTEDERGDLAARILYEDNHLLIADKRPGEIVQGDKTGDEPLSEKYKTLIAWRDGKPGQVFLGVPHRLDRPVGGVVVFAKTSKALARMAEMFRTGDVHKTYLALTAGIPAPPEGELVHWLRRNESLNKSFPAKEGAPGAKEARLAYRTLGRTDRYTLLEVRLFTGRHHQIRCQLAAMGCPIKGDLKYGAPRSNPDGSISLMARNIRFTHPVKGVEVDVTAPVPESWKGVDALI